MGRSLPELSLKEKVLLWLRHVDAKEEDAAGLASTQVGIADATGLSRGHVSRTVAPLLNADLIVEEPRRVSGFSRVLKGYSLTKRGRAEADGLADVLFACDVEVRRAGVVEERLPLSEVVGRRLAGRGLWPALVQVWESGFVERERASGAPAPSPRFVREMADAPEPGTFVGRSEELAALEEWLRGNGRSLVVEGPGGVGKTTLVGHALRSVDPRRHVIWVRVTDWVTVHDLVGRIDATLARLGHPPRGALDESAVGVTEHLVSRTRQLPLIVVLDDVHKASPSLARAIEGVVRAARASPSVKVVLIGRRAPLPPDLAREAELVGLGPMSADEADRLLAGRGVPAAQRGALVRAAQGNPLFLELLARVGTGPEAGGDIGAYLVRDLAADLTAAQRDMLDWSSAVRTPVPVSLWERLGVGSKVAAEELCRASLLKRRDDGRLEMHDLVREAFYDRLPFERRQRMHARLAAAFAPGQGRAGDVAEYLHHLVRAGRREEAVRWVLRNRSRLMDQAHRMFQGRSGQPEPA